MERHQEWGAPQSPVARRAVLAVVIPVGLLLAAFAFPVAIPDGVDELPAQRRAAGREALALAAMGCLDNPIQRGLTRAVRLTWLDPSWDPAAAHDAPSRAYRPEVSARLRTYGVFGVPLQRITVLDGHGIVCRHVDVERDYPLMAAIALTKRAGTARFLIRPPDDAFPPAGVVGRIDFARGRSVIDVPPPPALAHLPFDAAAVFAALEAVAPEWAFLGQTDDGSRFGLPDPSLALARQAPWVVVAATVDMGGVRSIEYVLPDAPTRRPMRLWLFAQGRDRRGAHLGDTWATPDGGVH